VMPTRSRRRVAGRPAGVVAIVIGLCATLGIGTGIARPQPAAAAAAVPLVPGGLEDLVGTVDPPVRAQLPADPRIWAAYTSRPTPEQCTDGSPACIDTTIAEMTSRFDSLGCGHDALFSMLYLRVTERYKVVAADPAYFDSAATVNREDAIFYDLYAETFAEWNAGRPQEVPPIWRLAYAAADASQETGSGDLLLGMAAHILRDLPFTLYQVATVTRHDHLQINPMLRSVYSQVVAEAAARFDPTVSLADTVPGTGTRVVDAIAQWRDKAWRDGLALMAARDAAARQAVADRIEREAWRLVLTVYLGLRYPVQELTVTRDAYCASHRAG
jgi:Family of unknown function (DUF5995)